MVHVAKRNANRCPTHPGALLREDVIPATGRTKTEIAHLLGISRQHLYDILRERKPVSPAVAVRLGKLFGDGAGIWVRMQAAFDTWNAERKEDDSPRQSGVDRSRRTSSDTRSDSPCLQRRGRRIYRRERWGPRAAATKHELLLVLMDVVP